MAFLTNNQLKKYGFKKIGNDVLISDKVSFHGVEHISIGNHSRIDDYCVISAGKGGLDIGAYVHISCFASLIGSARISIGDYAAISARVSIFSNNDDYSGGAMVNPCVPANLTNISRAPVVINKHVIIGAGSVVLPGVKIGEGAAVGALSLVKSSLEAFWIYSGCPARKLKKRKKDLLDFEKKLKK